MYVATKYIFKTHFLILISWVSWKQTVFKLMVVSLQQIYLKKSSLLTKIEKFKITKNLEM